MDQQKDKFPTEIDILCAIFDLVGALAHRLTGKVPSVRIRGKNGEFMWNYYEINNVRWLDPSNHLEQEKPEDAMWRVEKLSTHDPGRT